MTKEVSTIEDIILESRRIADEHGWSDTDIGSQFSNFHAEVSEAWEEFRNDKPVGEIYFEKDFRGHNKPEGVPIELADVIIRICDTAGRYNIDLKKAINLKLQYNETRPFRHGGKKA